MNKLPMAIVFGALALVLGFLAWKHGGHARLVGESFSVPAVGTSDVPFGDYGTVPDFRFTSQDEGWLGRDDLLGKLWVADFVFTYCASTCPLLTTAMQDLQAKLPKDVDVHLVSFSVDPARDTPARLTEYIEEHGIDDGNWSFLTGDKDEIYELIFDGFRLSVQDASPEQIAAGFEPILHSTRFVLVDAQGQIRGYYNALEPESHSALLMDLKRLAKRSAS